jgi:hypothetical protein
VNKRSLANSSKAEAPVSPKAIDKPLAKSSDPAFTKLTTYIKKTTHRAVKMRTVGEGRELSDLVEDLLASWLKENVTKSD